MACFPSILWRSFLSSSSKIGCLGRFLSLSIPLGINEEVRQALSEGGPIVALESTIISHGGMGFPKNIQTAQQVENAVGSRGAIPATIAIMDGSLVVGCSDEELARLGKNEDANCPSVHVQTK
jgi:pseudouridine-5'-phosphate glycosidase